MASLKVKARVLKDVKISDSEMYYTATFREWVADERFYHHLISFTTVMYNPNDGLTYCGLTAYDNDLLWTFDPETKEFRSCGYQSAGERFDVKIHRSLELAKDGTIYGATACLHALDQRAEAPGGKLFRYDPKTGKIEILAIPAPHDYIQTIALDDDRGILYGFTYPVWKLFRYDIASNRTKDFGNIGTGPHIPAIDDQGCVWGAWKDRCRKRDNLLRYDPETDEITYFDYGLPRMSPVDVGTVDSMLNGRDGYLYVGTSAGALCRLDPKTAKVAYLGKPDPELRMPGLILGNNGLLYCGTGTEGNTKLFAYDRESAKFIELGRVYDPQINDSSFILHHITEAADRTIYTGETDNPRRSGYLWECKVEM